MSFDQFYQTWLDQLYNLVRQLNSAPKPPSTDEQSHLLHQLVEKVMFHYTEYYRVKSIAANHDVLSVFTAPWSTTLERSLHWIAGWRPTTAFHLVYTEASIRFETQIVEILRGLRTGDLGDLSPGQFRRVSELQCEAVLEENAITDELSEWQDGASDLIEISGGVNGKMEGLVTILNKADNLRLKTIKSLTELLTPPQAVQFLIAAAQLHFGIRGWGVDHDRERNYA